MPISSASSSDTQADPAAVKRAQAAERQRRARERRTCGLKVYPVEAGADLVEALVQHGLLEPEDASDDAMIARALGQALEKILSHA
jgi:hypothetical protein